MNKLLFNLYPLLIFALLSCEETIVLDIDQSQQKIVIEGLVCDQPGKQLVKVSRSVDFYQSVRSIPLTNAIVSITDDNGTIFIFTQASEDGDYEPITPFVGEVGRSYHLTVQVDGQLYEAYDQLLPVIPIDSLGFQINEDEKKDPADADKIYEITLFAREQQDTKDYYLFQFFRNGELAVDSNNDIYVSDDIILGENIEGLPSPVFYAFGDTARVEMSSLSRDGYLFYNNLSLLINNDGGMFGPPPANPRTNLSNGAFGFFQASSIATAELVIK